MEEVKGLVSIGMPVFNDRKFLPDALKSILEQSYADFELIISDDCSTDGSREICLEAARTDPRISYIRQEKNLGISRNMTFLLQLAKGQYFMWAANDDLWHPDFIRELVAGLQLHQDSVAAFSAVKEIDEAGRLLKMHAAETIDYRAATAAGRLRKLIDVFYDGFGYGLFVRKEILEVKFPVWWWINRNCPYNNIYPSLCFYLTKGNYISCGTEPLWYNRIKDPIHVNHRIPFPDSYIRGFLAHALRKLNLVWVSLSEIRQAGGSIGLIGSVSLPMVYKWWLRPVFYDFLEKTSAVFRGKLNFW